MTDEHLAALLLLFADLRSQIAGQDAVIARQAARIAELTALMTEPDDGEG